jgi:antitoxin (DNA-binding transcriptional repressor) of toxin-antitoxin stability system
MKTVTATEARRVWFRLLDEVAAGEVVVVERGAVRLELRRADLAAAAAGWSVADYRRVLRVAEENGVDRWGWEWNPDSGELSPADADGE